MLGIEQDQLQRRFACARTHRTQTLFGHARHHDIARAARMVRTIAHKRTQTLDALLLRGGIRVQGHATQRVGLPRIRKYQSIV